MLENTIGKFKVAGELFRVLWRRKLWWMIPMFIVLLIFAILMIFMQGSPLAPFIYPLF